LVRKQKHFAKDNEFILPTPCPPLLTNNGANLMPISDVWTYITELKELAAIAVKRSQLISGLHLRGYAAAQNADLINEFSRSTNPALNPEKIVTASGFLPTKEEPLIYYVDNQPRLQLLEFLQNEHKFLTERIYQLTGISEQMRNVASNEDDETATSVRLKSKFGSRRLKEHQQKLLDYWTEALKIALRRICQSYDITDIKSRFSYQFPISNKKEIQEIIFELAEVRKQLQQVQAEMSQGGQVPPSSQWGNQQAAQQQEAGSDDQLNPTQPVAPSAETQAQGMPNQNTQFGMQGADLPNATILQHSPVENDTSAPEANQAQTKQVTPLGFKGQQAEQLGVDQTQQAAQQNQQQLDQNVMAPPQGQMPQPDQTGQEAAQGQEGMQMPQGQDDLSALNEELLQREMSLNEQYEDLLDEVTWDKIIEFLRKDDLVSFLVSCRLDDLENKIIQDEKKNSDLEYMNTLMNIVNQIIANVNSNPKFCDMYTSVFSLALDNFDQTKAQRDSIDQFIKDIKKSAQDMINNPPQQPPPSPDDQYKLAQAQELNAKVGLIQAQVQEIYSKIQQPQEPAAPQQNQPSIDEELQKMVHKHAFDMELQNAKIKADQLEYQSKMEADRQLLQMKIEADKLRYQEKTASDYAESSAKDINPNGIV
jgi:hypothetical protein